jgi:hypothetical protein
LIKPKNKRRNPPMNIPQPIILDIENLMIKEEKSKEKTKTENEKPMKNPKKTKSKKPMEIKDFHHPRKVRTCQGWETPSCGESFRKFKCLIYYRIIFILRYYSNKFRSFKFPEMNN